MSLGNYNMYKLQKVMQVKQHCYAVSEAAPTQMKIDVRNKTVVVYLVGPLGFRCFRPI